MPALAVVAASRSPAVVALRGQLQSIRCEKTIVCSSSFGDLLFRLGQIFNCVRATTTLAGRFLEKRAWSSLLRHKTKFKQTNSALNKAAIASVTKEMAKPRIVESVHMKTTRQMKPTVPAQS
jgi:hypothetical protein